MLGLLGEGLQEGKLEMLLCTTFISHRCFQQRMVAWFARWHNAEAYLYAVETSQKNWYFSRKVRYHERYEKNNGYWAQLCFSRNKSIYTYEVLLCIDCLQRHMVQMTITNFFRISYLRLSFFENTTIITETWTQMHWI